MIKVYSIIEYYAQNGGIINFAIFCAAVAIIYVGSGKLYKFRVLRKNVHLYISEIADENYLENEHSIKYYKNRFREKLLETVPDIDSGIDTIAALIMAAPLLGLLGTVIGMIKTFSLITTFGTANPVVLTQGITVSLLTTQAGLLVAFPCMIFHNYIKGRRDATVHEIITGGEKMINCLVQKKGAKNV